MSDVEATNEGKSMKPNEHERQAVKPHLHSKGEDFYAKYLQVNEEVEDQAPLLVVIQGPKKSGKTTLLRSLVKHYTDHRVKDPIGPITVRSGKTQRITFIECPSDMHAMMDLSKVADLVLLCVDASVGFEMETFEFISLLNNHGFPNVMGVLTHLDFFTDGKQLRRTRKQYKKRFGFEVGDGYKLFYLQGVKNDLYLKNDTINLARFISIIRFTPVRWKSEHPFVMADRFERSGNQLSIWGYIRGCTYRVSDRVHLVGVGDYSVESMEEQNDPCEVVGGEGKMRTLKKKDRVIYAPMSNLGFMSFEASGGFITIPDGNIVFTDVPKLEAMGQIQRKQQEEGEEEEEVEQPKEVLQEGVRMVRELQNLKSTLDNRMDEEIDLIEGVPLHTLQQEVVPTPVAPIRELVRMKDRVNQALQHIKHTAVDVNISTIATDLHDLIYGSRVGINNFDGSRYASNNLHSREHYQEIMRPYFVTGGELLEENEEENENEQEQKPIYHRPSPEEEEKQAQEREQKQREEQLKRQGMVNELVGSHLGMYRRGKYVKVILKNVEESTQIDSPLILARVNVGEDNLGYLKVRIKRHRWYSNILKSNDPVVVSVGWRRFQTMPVFCVEDPNDRIRFIKYSPQWDYSLAILYGCFAPQGTGLCVTQTLSSDVSKFRIAATGTVLELNHSFDVMKKLKLVGTPYRIYKNSALIRGMLNSTLEVAKFQGALIKTVSGVRGIIKKSSKEGEEGTFRATFEDKILMSDLVLCRTWVRCELSKYYRQVGSHAHSQRLLRTTWELRQEQKALPPQNPDSLYRDIERQHRKFAPLVVPRRLEESLPFESRQKVRAVSRREAIRNREDSLPLKTMLTDREKEVYSMIQRLNTIKRDKIMKRTDRDQQKKKIGEAREKGIKRYLEEGRKAYKNDKTKEKFRKKSKAERTQYE